MRYMQCGDLHNYAYSILTPVHLLKYAFQAPIHTRNVQKKTKKEHARMVGELTRYFFSLDTVSSMACSCTGRVDHGYLRPSHHGFLQTQRQEMGLAGFGRIRYWSKAPRRDICPSRGRRGEVLRLSVCRCFGSGRCGNPNPKTGPHHGH